MDIFFIFFLKKFSMDRMAPKNYEEDLEANKTLCL